MAAMDKKTNLFLLGYMTLFLFPVVSGADSYIKLFVKISFVVVFLMLLVFIPVFVRAMVNKGGGEFSSAYRNTQGLIIPFLLVACVSVLWGLHPGAYWEEGPRKILMDLNWWVVLLLSIGIASSVTVRKHHRLMLIIMLLGSCASIWVDVIAPGTFSEQTERTSGFYGNANDGALSIMYMAIATINWKKHDLLSIFILVLVGLAVFTTLSVEGLILLTIVTGSYIVLNLGGEGKLFRKIAFVIVTPVLLFFLAKPLIIEILETSVILEGHSSKQRLEEIINMTKGDMTFAEDHDRWELVRDYLELIQEKPIVGHGTAFIDSQIQGPHNMYLKQWTEYGLLGIMLYLTMLLFIVRHFFLLKDNRGMVFSLAIIYAGFFDQNVLQSGTIMVLLGTLGVLAYLEKSEPAPLAEPRVRLATE